MAAAEAKYTTLHGTVLVLKESSKTWDIPVIVKKKSPLKVALRVLGSITSLVPIYLAVKGSNHLVACWHNFMLDVLDFYERAAKKFICM